MLKKMLVFALAACLCLMTLPALAEDDLPNTVNALGSATVTVSPDSATFSIGVSTQDKLVAAAQTANAATMQQVLDALRKGGVADADLQTQNYSVSPLYSYENSKFGDQQSVTGYEVSNTVLVTVRALDQLPTLLDAAMAAGANQSYGISFSSSQYSDAYDKAMEAAAQDAVRKARLLAAAVGRTPGAVLEVIENNDGYSLYDTNKSIAYSTVSATPIESGSLTVTASVHVVMTLE